MLRDFTLTEKYEEAMSDEHPPTALQRVLLQTVLNGADA